MIIHINKNLDGKRLEELAAKYEAVYYPSPDKFIFVVSSKIKTLPVDFKDIAIDHFVTDSDIQLASRSYLKETRKIKIGIQYIGGDQKNTIVIAGPCAIESEKQIRESAALLKELGIIALRAGAYKPRTSPYTFQGLGKAGLELLDKVGDENGLQVVTEVRDASQVDDVIEHADIIQIGAKSMYDHGILRKCAKAGKPIILKRGFGATLQEFVQCAEFMLSGGNEQVILCERGIRTFETKTRFTLDLCGVAYLKEYTNLPIIVDPSHAIGWSYGVSDLARAAMAMGVDGLLIEVHPDPKVAKSDASQQLNHDQFRTLFKTLKPIAEAIGKQIV
jgi:3-deoxy-7-phosphoheptulonate synthase